jgi:hypothetical protein
MLTASLAPAAEVVAGAVVGPDAAAAAAMPPEQKDNILRTTAGRTTDIVELVFIHSYLSSHVFIPKRKMNPICGAHKAQVAVGTLGIIIGYTLQLSP